MAKTIIYYFSGTGNSLYAAKQIGKMCGDTQLVSMKADPTRYSAEEAQVIGFVYPVYMEGLPGGCTEFIRAVKLNTRAYIFALATCGRRAGNSYAELNGLLRQKGAELNFCQTAVTVANYINIYPLATSPKRRLPKLDEAIVEIYKAVEGRLSKPVPENNPIMEMNHRLNFIFPAMAKLYRTTEKCNGCGLCEKVCPSQTIRLVNGKPIWADGCRQCVACIQFCPKKAIEFGISTKFRTRYHHPAVTAGDIAKEMFYIK